MQNRYVGANRPRRRLKMICYFPIVTIVLTLCVWLFCIMYNGGGAYVLESTSSGADNQHIPVYVAGEKCKLMEQ